MNELTNLKYKFYLIQFLVVLFVNTNTLAQDFQSYLKANTIEKKCEIADFIAVDFEFNNLDSLRMLAQDLLRCSYQEKSEKGKNLAFFILGKYFIRVAKEREGIEFINKSKNYYFKNDDYNKITEIYNEIGNAYQYLGQHEEACKWYDFSLKYGKKASDDYISNIASVNLAQAYSKLGNYELAKQHAEQYKDWVLKLGKFKSIANAFSVLGIIELNQESFKQASYYFEQSYEFAKRTNSYAGMGDAYTNLAIIQYYLNDLDSSKTLFKMALDFRKKVKNISKICDAYLNYGGILFELEDYTQAESMYNEGLRLAQKQKSILSELELNQALLELYKTYDLEKFEKVNIRIDSLTKKEKVVKKENDSINQKLIREVYKYDRENQDGFRSNNSKILFYIGTFILLLLAFYFIIRQKEH